MTSDQIKYAADGIKGGAVISPEMMLQILKDYLADRRELDARRRNFAAVEGKTFFYLFVTKSNRTESQLTTGVVENDHDSVRCINETNEIARRIDAALKRNAGTRTFETADGVKHDGCATLEKRCLELYRALKALKPLLVDEAKGKPRNKFTRAAVRPALAIIDEGEQREKEAPAAENTNTNER